MSPLDNWVSRHYKDGQILLVNGDELTLEEALQYARTQQTSSVYIPDLTFVPNYNK